MMENLKLCYPGTLHVLYKDSIRLEIFIWVTKTVYCMSEG